MQLCRSLATLLFVLGVALLMLDLTALPAMGWPKSASGTRTFSPEGLMRFSVLWSIAAAAITLCGRTAQRWTDCGSMQRRSPPGGEAMDHPMKTCGTVDRAVILSARSGLR